MASVQREGTGNLQPFEYEPLDRRKKCIRLLEVLRQGENGAIRCRLRTYAFENIPQYVALSYTWDRDGRYEYVECNEMRMKVGRNVWDFLSLYQFRASSGGYNRPIWIDAICIDQENVHERNHQVDQMREIYSTAERTILWLGQSVQDVAVAFHLEQVFEAPVTMIEDDIRWFTSLEQWCALTNLLQRPYWTRVWIVQEFILAKTIELRYGAHCTGMSGINRLVQWIEDLESEEIPDQVTRSLVTDTPGWKLFWHRKLWWRSHWTGQTVVTFGLWQLLENYADFQSTDVRDKVFGLLGLASNLQNGQPRIQADYSKRLAEIAIDLFRLRHTQIWTSEDGHPVDPRDTVKFLLNTLQIAEIDMAATILKQDLDLHQHLQLMLPHACMVIRLRHVSTIINAAFDSQQSKQLLARALDCKSTTSDRTAFHIPSKVSEIDLSRLSHLQHLRGLKISRRPERAERAQNWHSGHQYDLGWIKIYDFVGWWNEDGGASPEIWDPRKLTKNLRQRKDYPSFMCTNGRVGLANCHIEVTDQVFVADHAKSNRNDVALILRFFDNPIPSWNVVGGAILLRHDVYFECPASMARMFDRRSPEAKLVTPQNMSTASFYLLTRISNLRGLFRTGLLGEATATARYDPKRKKAEGAQSNLTIRNYTIDRVQQEIGDLRL